MLKLGIHMDNECCSMVLRIEVFALILPFICPFLSIFLCFFVFRLLRICVTVFFATYLLLHIHIVYSSALLKQCSGAIVRFSDSSSCLSVYFTQKI